MNPGMLELGMAAAGVVVAVSVALFAMRVVRRMVSGCLSTGLGCLVFVIGLIVLGTLLTARFGVTDLQGLVELLSGT
jgi:hypothetical protein